MLKGCTWEGWSAVKQFTDRAPANLTDWLSVNSYKRKSCNYVLRNDLAALGNIFKIKFSKI